MGKKELEETADMIATSNEVHENVYNPERSIIISVTGKQKRWFENKPYAGFNMKTGRYRK